jgi:magnesium transporter
VQAEHLNEPITRLASKDFTALAVDLTVAGALAQIRERGVAEKIIYFYVVDHDGRLVGVVPTRRLLTAALDTPLAQIMIARVVMVPDTATIMEACEMFLLHKFLAFPVVDAQQRLVGVVNVNLFTDEVFDLSEKSHMDDVFQTIGFRVAEVQNASPARAFRLRFPWLLATIGGGICCALLAARYEATLATSLVLAFFLTLVLGLAESVSAQSLTVAIQSLHGREPDRAWFLRAMGKEFLTAVLLGGACGLIVGLVAWLWRGSPSAAAVIGGSITLAMVTACLLGLAVPTILHRLKLDPRIAAGPMTLALADIGTLLFYFNLAKFVLSRE